MPIFDSHENFSFGVITVAPSPATSGTTLSMSNSDAAKMPNPATANYNLVVWQKNTQPTSGVSEIIRVTARGVADSGGVGNTQFTIVRAQEGSSARVIVIGDWAGNNITKKWVTDIENAINQKTVVTVGTNAGADYVCDGTSDNVEIQAANDFLAGSGGIIHLKPGTYMLAATIQLSSNVILEGEGIISKIVPSSGSAIATVTNAVSGAIQIAAQSNVTVRNLCIDGNLLVSNGLAIFISESTDVLVENCSIINNRGFGVFSSAGFITSSGITKRVTIRNNYIYGLGNNDQIGGGKHTATSLVYDVKADGNRVFQDMTGGGAYGTSIDLTGVSLFSITNNTCYGSIVLGVEWYPNVQCTVSNNYMHRAVGSSNVVQINANTAPTTTQSCNGLVIANNQFEEIGQILVKGITGFKFKNFSIVGNSMPYGNTSVSPIQVNIASQGTIVGNNVDGGLSAIQAISADNIEIEGNVFSNCTNGVNDQTGVSTINIGHNTYNTVTTKFINGNPMIQAPSLTTTQRDAMTGVQPGALIYNTTTARSERYDNGVWRSNQGKMSLTVGFSDADYNTDGTADNIEIQSAINAVNSLGGGTVFIKSGIYSISNTMTIPSNITIAGVGNSTVLTLANASNVHLFTNADTTNGNSGIIIRDLRADGNKANQTSAGVFVQMDATGTNTNNNIRFENLWLVNMYQMGMNPKGIRGLFINNILFENCGSSTLDHSLYIIRCTQFEINNIVSRNPGGGHFKCRSSSDGSVNNFFGENSGSRSFSVTGQSDHVSLTGCYAYNSTNAGFVTIDEDGTVPRWITFTACRAVNSATEGFDIQKGNQHILNGCMARNSQLNGIKLTSVSKNTISGCEVFNNDLSQTNNYGINLTNSSQNTVIGNVCMDDQTSHTATVTGTSGQAVLTASTTRLFSTGERVTVAQGATSESKIILSKTDTTITLTTNLSNTYTSGATLTGVATQDYGINESGTSNNNSIVGNVVSGNTVAQISTVGLNTEIGLNPGY